MNKQESPTLEYKEAISRSFIKTVSAFANYQTGKIVFGIDNGGNVKGISDLTKSRLKIENMINDSLNPIPIYSLQTDAKKNTITLIVQEGPDKPYLAGGKAYKRSDTSTVEVDRLALKRLILAGEHLSFDSLNYDDSSLTFDYLATKMIQAIDINGLGTDVMRTLGLVTPEGNYTNAAAILADKNSFAGIDIVRFGTNINELRSRVTLEGVSALVLFDTAMEAFEQHYRYELIEGNTRREIYSVPPEAFREAIANAIVHRTWDTQSNITISMFNDRIEIASPGPLPPGITESEYLGGKISNLRNPLIAQVFFRLHYIEMFGTGVARINNSYAIYSRKPVFSIRNESIVVALPTINEIKNTPLSDVEKTIMLAFKNGARLTRAEIAASSNMSKDRTIRALNSLIKKGVIHKEGEGRNTRYGRA